MSNTARCTVERTISYTANHDAVLTIEVDRRMRNAVRSIEYSPPVDDPMLSRQCWSRHMEPTFAQLGRSAPSSPQPLYLVHRIMKEYALILYFLPMHPRGTGDQEHRGDVA